MACCCNVTESCDHDAQRTPIVRKTYDRAMYAHDATTCIQVLKTHVVLNGNDIQGPMSTDGQKQTPKL